MGWYSEVSRDVGKIPNAVAFFEAELEEARGQFSKATSLEEKQEIGRKVQERLWAIGASGELGQFFTPVAYRNNVKGLIKSPVQFFWNMSVE